MDPSMLHAIHSRMIEQNPGPICGIPPIEYGEMVATPLSGQVIDWGKEALNVPEHWGTTTGKGVNVAVLDTGTPTHPDIPPPLHSENFTNSPTASDVQGHATHVGGIVGAINDDNGVVGVAPGCKMGFFKVLGDNGTGSSRGIELAIRRVTALGVYDIINLSVGGGYDAGVERALIDFVTGGKFAFAAVGNDGWAPNTNTIGYPGRLAITGGIGAYSEDGSIADFSSRGAEVDFVFPGDQIVSTYLNSTYRKLSGTSMSTPFASGLAALTIAAHRDAGDDATTPLRNWGELKEHWRRHAIDRGEPGKDNHWGWGIPQPDEVLGGLETPAPAPEDLYHKELFGLQMYWPVTVPKLGQGVFVTSDKPDENSRPFFCSVR